MAGENVFSFDTSNYKKNSERTLRESLLGSIPTGDKQISAMCKMLATSFKFPRSQCVLEVDNAYLAIGRYGWLSPDFNFSNAEQKDLYETTEFIEPRSEILDFEYWPEQLQDIRYLLVSPILMDGKRVGFCGVADIKRREPASADLISCLEIFSELCAHRMGELQRLHLSAQLLISGIPPGTSFL